METANDLIQSALEKGQAALSEYESKKLLAFYGIPTTREELAENAHEAVALAEKIGFPVVLKACSPALMHKTDTGGMALNLRDAQDVTAAYEEITDSLDLALEGMLVQEMVNGQRELVIGLTRDPQFGPCVMLGFGGIMTEVLKDTVFRVAPIELADAREMTQELKSSAMLGAFRGQKPADLETICRSLITLGDIGLRHEEIVEIDVNPMIVDREGRIKAADALVVLAESR